MDPLTTKKYERVIVGVRVAMSADTSHNAKPQFK